MRRWIGIFQLVPFSDNGLDKLYCNLFNSLPVRPLLPQSRQRYQAAIFKIKGVAAAIQMLTHPQNRRCQSFRIPYSMPSLTTFSDPLSVSDALTCGRLSG